MQESARIRSSIAVAGGQVLALGRPLVEARPADCAAGEAMHVELLLPPPCWAAAAGSAPGAVLHLRTARCSRPRTAPATQPSAATHKTAVANHTSAGCWRHAV